MKKLFFVAFLMMIAGLQAWDTTPFQIGIWPPRFQIAPEEMNVGGLKLNLPFGANKSIAGLDLGIACSSDNARAVEINVLMNRTHKDFAGLQLSLLNQSGNAAGIILGGFNITDDHTGGLQVGIINSSMKMHGIQLGLINYCESMCGVQIGLANIITESVVCFFPIVNFCF